MFPHRPCSGPPPRPLPSPFSSSSSSSPFAYKGNGPTQPPLLGGVSLDSRPCSYPTPPAPISTMGRPVPPSQSHFPPRNSLNPTLPYPTQINPSLARVSNKREWNGNGNQFRPNSGRNTARPPFASPANRSYSLPSQGQDAGWMGERDGQRNGVQGMQGMHGGNEGQQRQGGSYRSMTGPGGDGVANSMAGNTNNYRRASAPAHRQTGWPRHNPYNQPAAQPSFA
eukprot:Ihof_evm4s221 gene=Ihof_evmTU4s221